MSGIRGKNTRPEFAVRRALFALGYRFRLHRRDLPGAPDIVLPGGRIAIFVHGCFWHMHAGCRFSKLPSTRTQFWQLKLQGNAQRDLRDAEALSQAGWRVLVVWECATRDQASLARLGDDLSRWIESAESRGEIKL